MGKECVPQVSALCWRAHTEPLYMDRPGSPAGREDNTLKVLPSVAAWMEFDELTFIIIMCHLSGCPHGWMRGRNRFPGCAGVNSSSSSLRSVWV